MRRTIHRSLIASLMLSASGGFAQSDICISALALACGAVATGNTGPPYTVDVAPFCGTGDGTQGGVWYRVTGTGNNITASLCGSAYDTKIRVYSGTCAALVCVAGNDNFCGLQSQVTWASTLATAYRILVHGFGAATGAYTLTITCSPPPPPSMCYSNAAVPYAADPYAGTSLIMTDDVHSAVVNIGFNFCFDGSTYSQCVISSNNYVTFDLTVAGTYSPWPTVPVPALTPTQIRNSVLNPWQDLYPPAGGTITYQTLGVPPNRRFVVSYWNVPMFSCTQQLYTSQTVLYESSNCIGSYILTKPVCAAWNGGNAVHALHNSVGTLAVVVPGRNNTQWTATSLGRLFVPTCVPCSTATSAACLNAVLPIELLTFRGHHDGAVNILEWATASEQSTDHFIVERSANGEQFEAILQVDAAGQSNAPINYMGNDAAPLRGINYYRLHSMNVDGTGEFSEVIAVNTMFATGIFVFPNPATSGSHYVLPEATALPATLLVHDLAGRVVKGITVDALEGPLDITGLSSGSYLLQLSDRCVAGAVRFAVE